MEDQLVGTRINRYQILDCINKTDLIGLYKAFDTRLERNVLLKLVIHSSDYSEKSIDFFLNESRALAKLSHPNIAKILDFGNENGKLFLISEYFSGRTLSELMTGPMNWQHVVEILIPVTEALAYAHSKGIIHRDLKPENIAIADNNVPILSDFSLVRIIEGEETRDVTGTVIGLGSPAYISPEQGKGMTVDFRADIYSLGVIFFEMITGQKPFSAETSMELVIQHVMAAPPRPKKIIPELPTVIEDIILTSLSKDVEQRIQSMEEFSERLKAVLLSTSLIDSKASPFFRLAGSSIRYIAVAIIVLTLAGVITVWAMNRGTPALSTIATTTKPTDPIPTATLTGIMSGNTDQLTPPSSDPETLENSSANPFSMYEIPALPALPGTTLPVNVIAMDRNNIGDMVELARWGYPDVQQLAFINNDQVLLSATSAGVYYIDSTNLTPKLFFDTKGVLSTFATSTDGEWVATGDVSGNVAVWDILDGSELMRFEKISGPIRSMAFSPDRRLLAAAAADRSISVWDLEKRTLLFKLVKHSLDINKIIFSPAGDYIISGGDDFRIMVWDVETGELVNNYQAAQKINDLDISLDGMTLVLAMNNATIEIWNFQSGKKIGEIKDIKIVDPYTFIKFLPNGQLILTGSADGVVRLWSVLSYGKVWETPVRLPAASPVRTISISSAGTKFAVMYEDGLAEIWSISNQVQEVSISLEYEPVLRALISADDRLLAFQGGNSYVEIWSLPEAIQEMTILGTLPRGFAFSPDGDKILIQRDGLNLHSTKTSPQQELFTLNNFPKNGFVNYSPDGKIVIASSGGSINLWSVSTGRELSPSTIKNQGSCRVIYRLNGGFLAAGSANGVVGLDEYVDYFCAVPRGPRTISEDFISDGSIIALSLENKMVEVWDSRTDGEKITLTGQFSGNMLDVAVSPNGTLLASSSASGTIEIYDLLTLELVKTLDLHAGPVHQVLFSNNGKYIILGAADGTVRLFGVHP